MNFYEAMKLLRDGKKIARKYWFEFPGQLREDLFSQVNSFQVNRIANTAYYHQLDDGSVCFSYISSRGDGGQKGFANVVLVPLHDVEANDWFVVED